MSLIHIDLGNGGDGSLFHRLVQRLRSVENLTSYKFGFQDCTNCQRPPCRLMRKWEVRGTSRRMPSGVEPGRDTNRQGYWPARDRNRSSWLSSACLHSTCADPYGSLLDKHLSLSQRDLWSEDIILTHSAPRKTEV